MGVGPTNLRLRHRGLKYGQPFGTCRNDLVVWKVDAESEHRETVTPSSSISHPFAHSFGVGPCIAVETSGHYVFSPKMGPITHFSSCVLSFQVSMYVSTFAPHVIRPIC